MIGRVNTWLKQTNQISFSIYAIAAAFITYFSMYSFRKPFTAGMYEGLIIWGIDYKIIAVTIQIIGYTLSKFLGIKLVSELKASTRIINILILIGIAGLALFFFAITPRPYNVFFLFLNGLPLGMIWGVVFSFLEGRRFTELLGAGMATSFIVSSGIVKATGRSLVVNHGVSEFWMPLLTGLIYLPALFIGVYMLSAIPAPTESDEAYRTKRVPMDRTARKNFFATFAIGIFLTVTIYVALTIFRDVRDNFAVEIWSALGYNDKPYILATAEIPIALAVLIIIGLMIFIKNNRTAFYLNQSIIIFAGLLLLLTTFLFGKYQINPAIWMILNGFSMYLAYIAFHTFLFERWIALFRYESNIGFLMYIADAFGYLGSVTILLIKNFINLSSSWLSLFTNLAYITAFMTIALGVASTIYFIYKEKNAKRQNPLYARSFNNK
jgi:hypothetical protein